MATDPFRTFLCKEICQELSSDDIRKMSFCIKDKVNTQDLENAKTGTELMHIAMKANLFTETNTSGLEDMLDASGRQDLVGKVQEFKTNRVVLPPPIKAPCNLDEAMIGRMHMETIKSRELTETMETEDGVTLSGTTGSGKTHLAVYYGYEFHKNHPTSTVWMMRSKDQASLQMSMTKLANKLDILTGKTKDTENPINELGHMIAHVLLEKTTEKPHIIIFDDVGELCQKIVEGLIKMFVPMKKSHGSIKFIVTTIINAQLKMPKIPITKPISVDGFTEEEAISFLSGNQTCEMSETDALKNLALSMSCLPLGLSCAKSYMTNCSKSGKAFLKLLKANTLKKLDCNLKQHDESKRSLFSNLDTLIRFMEKDLDKDATEMFKMIQFLESENIPTILFELMSTSSGINIGDLDKDIEKDVETDKDIEKDVETCNSVSTDSLVQAVQKFSFGTVQGIDDKRIIHTHTAVSLTLGAFTDEDTKMRLLKRLLWTFALILDKENRHQEDHNLMVSVLPQAKSVLLHAMNMMEDDLETYLLIAFVNDLVAYISNFEGLLALEKYHSEKSLDYWYKVMETTEKEMNEGLSYKKQRCTTYVEHREFARAKADAIDKKLTNLRQRYEQKIDRFIRHFILQRRRTRADVKLLSKYLENYEEEALTKPQYGILCEKERAVPLENMTDTFIKEMILYTFYTYGRRIFYIGKYAGMEEKRKFCHYLFLAAQLGEILRRNSQQFLPLYSLLAQRNGILELIFEDIPELRLATVDSLLDTATTFEQLLEDKSCYYIFGIFKMHAPADSIHRATCLKQLLRTYIKLLKLDENSPCEKTKIITNGKTIVKELENVEPVFFDPKNSGIWTRIGQFQFAVGDYKEAEMAYQRVCPPCLLQGEVKSRFVSKHELAAVHGLVDCYYKEARHEAAKSILKNLLNLLPDIQAQEKENAHKRIG